LIDKGEAMTHLERFTQSRLAQAIVGGVMASAWMLFAYAHVRAFLREGDWSLLLFCLSETITAAIFLVRSQPATVSARPSDWLIACVATFAPMSLMPVGHGLTATGQILIVGGALLQLAGLFSLNRSLGLVPARRVIKTGGAYRFVRHPLYASYVLTLTGYLLSNPAPGNLLLYLLGAGLLAVRAVREEEHLAQSEDYRTYMGKVKFRVIPYVF
jgi:protein-S-isoprenylcysteine O-methyltransferase Ste14